MGLFTKKRDEIPAEVSLCSVCGKRLDPAVSGQISKYLDLNFWPCPECHVWNSTLLVSSGGVAAERGPLLGTIQHKTNSTDAGPYEARVGIGSIAKPSQRSANERFYTGRDAFFWMIDLLNPAYEARIVAALRGE